MKRKSAKPAVPKSLKKLSPGLSLLVATRYPLPATRKGAWLLHGDATRRNWRVAGPHFLGQIGNPMVLDPRDGKTMLAATKT